MTSRRPQLHLITPPDLAPLDVVRRVERAVPHGVDAVHLRLPGASAREVYDLSMVLQPLMLEFGTRLVVNDRVDVALAVNAWGVQLGARSLPVPAVRRVLGASAPVGASVHDVEEARNAESMGASWLVFGHVYETGSHPGEAPRGLGLLREVSMAVDVPVIAIGGISAGSSAGGDQVPARAALR